MRLFRVLPVLSLLFGTGASSLQSREPAAHPLDARDLVDVCASVHTPLIALRLSISILRLLGAPDMCLCLSGIALYLESDPIGILAVEAAGETAITNVLTEIILESAPNSLCTYPDYSVPTCVDGSPCGFTCIDGFTSSPSSDPTTCVCTAPNVVCNGECVAAGACPTSSPLKRRWVGSGSCTEMGHGWAACGVFGGGARAWECVDTAHDLESCGGCVLPLTPYSPIGQDCTAIPGVADVACHSGECMVRRCLPGYVVSRDGNSCTPKHAHSHVATQEKDDEYVQAMRYGLEHRPL
ncbi:hypothetical protein EDB83DRAFT_2316717 [Lactarius deliciosus]|nr:hypothetical protein EDB83DRAFT_2316717 [Lactarius deliciosus]